MYKIKININTILSQCLNDIILVGSIGTCNDVIISLKKSIILRRAYYTHAISWILHNLHDVCVKTCALNSYFIQSISISIYLSQNAFSEKKHGI